MIDIRLTGTPEEIARAKMVLGATFVIFSVSDNYPSRNNSRIYRAYIKAEAPLISFGTMPPTTSSPMDTKLNKNKNLKE